MPDIDCRVLDVVVRSENLLVDSSGPVGLAKRRCNTAVLRVYALCPTSLRKQQEHRRFFVKVRSFFFGKFPPPFHCRLCSD